MTIANILFDLRFSGLDVIVVIVAIACMFYYMGRINAKSYYDNGREKEENLLEAEEFSKKFKFIDYGKKEESK